MSDKIRQIREKIRALEEELETEATLIREKFSYTIEERKIRFLQNAAEYHRRLRKSNLRFVLDAKPSLVLVSPAIYAMIIPLLALDVAVSCYQAICFPIYGIKKVPRSDFIVLDRHELQYLNAFERFNCLYCSYANGLVAYLRQIAARTEKYWCPIKHAHKIYDPHGLYGEFLNYGDADAYKEWLKQFSIKS